MGRIYNNIVETVGRTPLVKLNKVTAGAGATILLKCEFFNPLCSVKDRIGMAMIEDAEKRGMLKKDTVIIEPTSGNTGIALAFVAAAKGYKLILTMPETMSVERRTLLAMLGAKLVLTPGAEGMKGAIARAEALAKETPNSWIPQQFENPANRGNSQKNHRRGNLGGHGWQGGYFGRGRRHGRHDHRLRRSHQAAQAVVSWRLRLTRKIRRSFRKRSPASRSNPARIKFKALGAGFIPKNLHLKDSQRKSANRPNAIRVSNDDAFAMARRLAKEEGILCGISTGANVVAAIEVANRPENKGKTHRHDCLLHGRTLFEHAAGRRSARGSGWMKQRRRL